MVPLLKETCSDAHENAKSINLLLIKKKQKFSILIDESTSITNNKLLCILVKFVSLENRKCITQLLELIPLNATDLKILTNIIGMACDNASVMIGIRDSFITRLKKEIPALVVLKCICHSSALIASKACAKLPDSCENVLHTVATYFSGSSKRLAILCELQNLFRVESHKILKLSGTRWLVLQKCVSRFLDNLEVLKHYFYLEIIASKNNSAIIIFNILNDNKIKAYILFLKYSLNSINDFNALFQSKKILIYKLTESSEHLIKQMECNFLLPNALKIFL
ncbi:hypothetical protein ACFW04_014435 [Cataglyphis niger]